MLKDMSLPKFDICQGPGATNCFNGETFYGERVKEPLKMFNLTL